MTTKIYAETLLPTKHGTFRLRCYRDDSELESLACLTRKLDRQEPVNLRIHSACATSEVFASKRCDCRQQLDFAMDYINQHTGLVVYLFQEGRGIGLGDKIRAYALQDYGYDTVEANTRLGLPVDNRDYQPAIDILRDLQIDRVNLISNNPDKLNALPAAGIDVVQRIPAVVCAPEESQGYLKTKQQQCGHLL